MRSHKTQPELIYLSMAGIPSRSANSIQTMKMASALAEAYQPFRLMTAGFVWVRNRPDISISSWYGIKKLPKIARMPEKLFGSYPFQASRNTRVYSAFCFLYFLFSRNCILYTREEKVLKWSQWLKIPIIFEAHLEPSFRGDEVTKFVSSNPCLLGVVAISPYLSKIYQRALPSSKVLYCEDGVETDAYDRLPSKGKLRHQLKIKMGQFSKLVVYTGHLYKDRGIETIIDAAKHCPDTLFLLVGGWDADVEKRRKEIVEKGATNVELCGFRPHLEIPRYQKAADILLMPYSEKLNIAKFFSSLKLFEYMASNTPIIASNIPRVSEVLTSKGAYLVQPDNSHSLAIGINHVFAEYKAALIRARWARALAENYSWSSRARMIVKALL